MNRAVFLKEWLKLRAYIGVIVFVLVALIGYFWYGLDFEFKTVEPENMMWYRFTFLEYKPYEYIKWFLYLSSVILSFAQFIPEWSKKRIRIIAHLPLGILQTLSLHVGVGLFFITFISLIFTILGYGILSLYYPFPILSIFLQDSFLYWAGCVILYLGLSGAIVQKEQNIAFLKLLFTLVAFLLFTQLDFSVTLIFWAIMPIVLFIFLYDSMLSIKEQGVKTPINALASIAATILLVYFGKNVYVEKFSHHLQRYYIFYSPIKKDFVYQKNFGEHQFEYGSRAKESFSRKEYEKLLPFVYWADLDIQKKLPIDIDGVSYDKKSIKIARLSLSYHPKDAENGDFILYPLINSYKDQGIILFPDNMLYAKKDGFLVFHHDNFVEKNVTKLVNEKAKNAHISFPISHIWGRFTNMKNYDLGYLMQDSKGEIFNFRYADDKLKIRKINAPKDLIYAKIYENKQRKIAGFAIDSKSNVYLIRWSDFAFLPIKLPRFDYKSMNLRIIANAKYFLIRYDDTKSYFASVYDKNLDFIDAFDIK